MMKKILITGGAGFIGSHLVRLFVKKYPTYHIYNLDKLTYAGNLENLKDIEKYPNYTFIKGDIVEAKFISQLFDQPRNVRHSNWNKAYICQHFSRIYIDFPFTQSQLKRTVKVFDIANNMP